VFAYLINIFPFCLANFRLLFGGGTTSAFVQLVYALRWHL